MNIIPTVVISLLLALFYILIIQKCMAAFFISRKKQLIGYVAWIVYYIFQVIVEVSSPFSAPVTLTLNVILVFVVSCIYYEGSFRLHIMYSILICAIWMLVEIILHIILGMLGLADASGVAEAVTSNMIMLVFSVILNHYFNKNKQDIPAHYVLFLLAVMTGSIYIIHNTYRMEKYTKGDISFSFFVSILLLLINYIIFEVYKWLSQKAEYQRKNMLYEQQLELCIQQAEEREFKNLEIRRFRHDIKNYMSSLLGLIQSGNTETAIAYIHDFLNDGVNYYTEEVSHSGNIVVDSLVNHKCTLARRRGITFNANVSLPASLPFQAGHLTIIFGNLLENALDACRELKSESNKPYIELEASYTKNILTIITRNPYVGERKCNREGHFLTTKGNFRSHGLGLPSVEQSIKPYQGHILIDCSHNLFQVTVLIYGDIEKK